MLFTFFSVGSEYDDNKENDDEYENEGNDENDENNDSDNDDNNDDGYGGRGHSVLTLCGQHLLVVTPE